MSERVHQQALSWLPCKGEGHLTCTNDILANLMEADGAGSPNARLSPSFKKRTGDQ
jgi:hypothetical protein